MTTPITLDVGDAGGRVIRIVREELGMTQVEAAAMLGYSASTYGRIERGQATISERERFNICCAFGPHLAGAR